MAESWQAVDGAGMVRGIARWEIRDRAQGAWRSIVDAAGDCLSRWTDAGTLDGAVELPVDVATRTLRGAVEEYAHILAALAGC